MTALTLRVFAVVGRLWYWYNAVGIGHHCQSRFVDFEQTSVLLPHVTGGNRKVVHHMAPTPPRKGWIGNAKGWDHSDGNLRMRNEGDKNVLRCTLPTRVG